MSRMIDSLGMLLLSCALLAIGNHLLNVLIPLRLNEAEVGTLLIGMVMSANAVGIVLGCFYGKVLVIRVGYVRTFVLSCTLFTAIVLTYALFTNAYAWLALRVLGGFFTATAYVVVESWLNASSSVENRGRVLGWYLVVHYAATATGQLLVNADGPNPYFIFIIAALAIALSIAPVTYSTAPVPESQETESLSFLELFRISPVGVVGVIAAGFSFGTTMSMSPIFGDAQGWTVAQISFFMASVTGGALLFQYPLGRLSDAWDRRKMLGIVQVFGVATLAWMLWTPQLAGDSWEIIGLALLLGGVIGSAYPLSSAVVFDWLRPSQMVAATGRLIFTYAIGAIAGPALVALVMESAGPAGFPLFLITVHVVMLLYILYRVQVRKALPIEVQEDFVVVPRMPPGNLALDPRTDPDYDANDPGPLLEIDPDYPIAPAS